MTRRPKLPGRFTSRPIGVRISRRQVTWSVSRISRHSLAFSVRYSGLPVRMQMIDDTAVTTPRYDSRYLRSRRGNGVSRLGRWPIINRLTFSCWSARLTITASLTDWSGRPMKYWYRSTSR